MPLTVKLVPVNVNSEIVRSAEPLFDRTRLLVAFWPLDTAPKSIDVGLTESCGFAFATAEAERFTTTGLALASVDTLNVPVMLPAAVGVTATLNFADCPAPNASGMARPVTEYCGLETCVPVTFTVAVPEFETVMDCVDCFPTAILPKLTLVGLNWRTPVPVGLLAVTTPAQPLSIARTVRIRAITRP